MTTGDNNTAAVVMTGQLLPGQAASYTVACRQPGCLATHAGSVLVPAGRPASDAMSADLWNADWAVRDDGTIWCPTHS